MEAFKTLSFLIYFAYFQRRILLNSQYFYRDFVSGLHWKRVLWSPSYFANSVEGASISACRQYINPGY